MKELKWRDGMTIEEKIDAGFKAVLRRFDSQEQEINGLRQFVSQKLVELNGRFDKVDERFDKTDARNEIRFNQVESALMTLRGQVYDVKENTKSLIEDMTIVKMDVKDLHTRLDGLATTVDRHDTAIEELQKAVGHK